MSTGLLYLSYTITTEEQLSLNTPLKSDKVANKTVRDQKRVISTNLQRNYFLKQLIITTYGISPIWQTKCQKHFSQHRKNFFSRSKNQGYCSRWIPITKFTQFTQKSNKKCQLENYPSRLWKTFVQNIRFFYNKLLPSLSFYPITGFTTCLHTCTVTKLYIFLLSHSKYGFVYKCR